MVRQLPIFLLVILLFAPNLTQAQQQCTFQKPPGYDVYAFLNGNFGNIPVGLSVINFFSGYGAGDDFTIDFSASLDPCTDPAFTLLGTQCQYVIGGRTCYAVVSFLPTQLRQYRGILYGDINIHAVIDPITGTVLSPAIHELDLVGLGGTGIPSANLDLSVTNVSIPGGGGNIPVGQTIEIDVTVAGTGFNSPETRSTYVTLEVGSNQFSQAVDLSDLANSTKTLQFFVSFQPNEIGTQNIRATIALGNSLNEVNYANNSQSTSILVTNAIYKLVGTFISGFSGQSSIRMSPSVVNVPGCRLPSQTSSQSVLYQCINSITGLPVSGCIMTATLVTGDTGGHDLPHLNIRPLQLNAQLPAGLPIVIPQSGVILNYEAPEVAGDVILLAQASAPDFSTVHAAPLTFQVRSMTDYQRIIINGLTFDVDSHPGQGEFGTQRLVTRLELLYKNYIANALDNNVPQDQIPDLKSEAASMRLGGLFDISKNYLTPHCGHRDGETIDLSLSVFNGPYRDLLLSSLQRAIVVSNMGFPYAPESPNPPPGSAVVTHWHIKMN